MNIQILNKNQINKYFWNKTVNDSLNSNIFGYSWFLNIIADDWLGIIVNNYEKVMPLPYIKFLHKKIIYLPDFMPYTSLYSKSDFKKNEINEILTYLKKHFIISELKFNRFNQSDYFQKNYFYNLNLFEGYNEILPLYYHFKDNPKIKSYKVYVVISPFSIKDFIIRNNLKYNRKKIRKLLNLVSESSSKRSGIVYFVYNDLDKLTAIAVFLISNLEISFIFWESIDTTALPLYLVLDKIFKNYYNSGKILSFYFNHPDFEKIKKILKFKKYGYYFYENSNYSKLVKLAKKFNLL